MPRQPAATLLEAILVLVLGSAFALVANQLSPRGLSLTRDYFGRPKIEASVTPTKVSPASNAPAAPTVSPTRASAAGEVDSELKRRLEEKGLSLVDGDAAEKLFRDPLYLQELIIFVDARNDRHYQEGHIPGAYQFDRYYPEKYLPTVVPACLNASKIVVYCTGGKCEDSEFAALTLVEAGTPAANVSVYAGGITDWVNHKFPVEIGARKSGNLKPQ